MKLTSRSFIESYQTCPRFRYNQQFLLGKGVVPVRASVPLATGGAIHRGVEHLLNRIRIGQEADVETAVQLAVQQYVNDVEKSGFRGKDLDSDRQQKFTFLEQKALVEALVRAWALREMPKIKERYKVLAVEREIEPIKIIDDIYLMARVDAEFQDKETGDYHNYSLKSCKQWDERMENSYKSDLQGVTEIWSVEGDSKRFGNSIANIICNIELLKQAQHFPSKNLATIEDWFSKQDPVRKVMAIRFCFLIKGQWKKEVYGDENSLKVTFSPLIRGYRNIGPSGISYAHSWFYPNPENRSGKSILGKGWESFNVWELGENGVKQWIEALDKGTIQPECGDILGQQVVTPVEYFRSEDDIYHAMLEVQGQEKRVFEGANLITVGYPDCYSHLVADYFPHYRKHCFFMFGERCEYYDLCWKPEVGENPIESGLYQIREPHHETER